METKICSKCNRELPLNMFAKNRNEDGTRGFCKECGNKYAREYYRKHKIIVSGKITIVKKCPICGADFETKIRSQKYCSEACRNKYNHKELKRYKLKCNVCKKEFITNQPNIKYCSNECRNKDKAKHIKKEYKTQCKVCGKEYMTSNPNQKYCSDECRDKIKNKKYIKKEYNLKCKVCGKELIVNNPNQKYCSFECRNKANNKNKRYKLKCKTCKKEFISKNRLKKYCCKECKPKINAKYYKDRKSNSTIESLKVMIKPKIINIINKSRENLNSQSLTNQNINYWRIEFPQKIKDKILKRDEFKCYICGSEVNLQVHHIIPRQFGGSHTEENLITLCAKCHRHIETGNIDHAVQKCANNMLKVLNNRSNNVNNGLSNKEIIKSQSIFIESIFDKLSKMQNSDDEIKNILCSIDNFLENI